MSKRDYRSVTALALLCIALGLFVTFQFLRLPFGDERGWVIWEKCWYVASHPGVLFSSMENLLAVSSFFSLALLVLGSPFLVRPLAVSAPLRWVMRAWSALVLAGVWSVFWDASHSFESTVFPCLMLTPVFNLTGLMVLGKRKADGISL